MKLAVSSRPRNPLATVFFSFSSLLRSIIRSVFVRSKDWSIWITTGMAWSLGAWLWVMYTSSTEPIVTPLYCTGAPGLIPFIEPSKYKINFCFLLNRLPELKTINPIPPSTRLATINTPMTVGLAFLLIHSPSRRPPPRASGTPARWGRWNAPTVLSGCHAPASCGFRGPKRSNRPRWRRYFAVRG